MATWVFQEEIGKQMIVLFHTMGNIGLPLLLIANQVMAMDGTNRYTETVQTIAIGVYDYASTEKVESWR